jgi:hypothetical protein
MLCICISAHVQFRFSVSACSAYAFQRMFKFFSHDHDLNGGQDKAMPTFNSQWTLRPIVPMDTPDPSFKRARQSNTHLQFPMDTQTHCSSRQDAAIPTFKIQLAFFFLFLLGFSTLSRLSQKGIPFDCWACQNNERASVFFS